MARYMVIETFHAGAARVYERTEQRGRMLPAGLNYVESWVDATTLDRCFQLMETEHPELFEQWTCHWDDLVQFEIVPVVGTADARARVAATSGSG